MKKSTITRSLLIGIIVLIIILVQLNSCMFVSQAATITTGENETVYLSLSKINEKEEGYAFGMNTYGTGGKHIWNMVSSDENGNNPKYSSNFYCIKADYGDTWEDDANPSGIAIYNNSYNLPLEQNTTSTVANEVLQNNKLLWLIDNLYVKGESNLTQYLKNAGITYEAGQGYSYKKSTEHDYSGFISTDAFSETVTEEDIVAIQQVAIWHITNGGIYNKLGTTPWLQYTNKTLLENENSTDKYPELSNISKGRANHATAIYNYLVNEAENVAEQLGNSEYELKNSAVKLWLSSEKDEQPVIEVHKLTFDLSLRKAIVSVTDVNNNNKELINIEGESADRKLNQDGSISLVDTATLNIKTGTATYKHRKDPVVVEEGDIVEYAISVYNEGEVEGYAKEIVDQLPGTIGELILDNSLTEIESSTGNIYTVEYSPSTNKIKFCLTSEQPKVIPAYDGTTLSSETIKVKCIVKATASTESAQILTNIAYISQQYNSKTNQVITTDEVGLDRDSAPGYYPTYQNAESDTNQNGVTYWNLTGQDYGYIGSTESNTDLSNQNNYYQGIEDEDDFEKIVILPKIDIEVEKIWEDADNQDGIRPESITIRLLADGNEVDSKTVKEANNWTWTFENLPKYQAGKEIVYTITEDAVTDYTTTIDGYNVTNTHEPEEISISGSKTWEDANNQDGMRPESITINLLADGEKIDSKIVTEENNWTWTFENLPKYQAGQEIVYTITEDTVANYTTEIDGYNVTNTHEPEEISITGSKTWEDANNQDGIRPESITINLLADGEKIDSKIVTEENNWTWVFESLPKYKAGQEIVYTITEDTVANYRTEIDGYNVTNTHEPEEISISGSKTWEDANNQDGMRPESITIRLLADGNEVDSKTVTEANNWTWIFENLPKYQAGKEIEYTITEDTVANYTTEIEGYNITNTHEPEEITISGSKTWEDANNQDGIRPESITINLLADGEKIDSKTVTEANNWTWTFENLSKYQAGKEIEYTITEDTVANYTTEIDGYNITNTHEPEEITISGSKTWDDANNQDGIRPESITIRLLADGNEADSKTVTEANNWTWTFENLPKYQAGKEIVYTITEDAVTDYTTTIDGYNVTNKHIPGTLDISGSKTWEDANNQDGIRPESITIRLLADGNEVDSKTVTEANNWTWTFENLPKYQAGKEIVYTITEDEVEAYETIITGYNITNKHIPETINISGSKTWEDANNQDGKRPESITIRLFADGNEIDSKTVTEANNWTWTFENLPKYQTGKEIVYTITEDAVTDYTTKIDGYNITNSYTPEITEVSGSKTWEDAENQDGKRPESITISLLADGTVIQSKTVTANEDWKYTFANLPRYKEGREIVYTIAEDEVEAYETIITGYNITNKHIPETINISGTKIWVDNDNQDGIRPESITIKLLADEIEIASKVVTENDNWTWEFTDLPKYAAGTEIEYKIREDAIQGYETSYVTTKNGNNIITNITNTHKPETIDISVKKEWIDNKDYYGKRPESINVQLYANGIEQEIVELTSSNSWKYTWYELPKRTKGKEIEYIVKEINKEGQPVEDKERYNENYVTTYTKNKNATTITNTELTFDLKLIKYISAINQEQTVDRIQGVDLNKLNTYDESLQKFISTGNYVLDKEPIGVEQNDFVTYTFRIYNEGDYDGYATEISENIPEGLEFIVVTDGAIYSWDGEEQKDITEEIQESGMYNTIIDINSNWGYSSDSTIITTRALSEEIIKGYGKENVEYADSENKIDYKEIQVIFRVKENIETKKLIRNEAAITEDKAVDENDDEILIGDRDSSTVEWKKENSDKTYDEAGKWYIYQEDDEDYDNIITKAFDLSLRKQIIKVNNTLYTNRYSELDKESAYANTIYDYYDVYKDKPKVKAGDIVTYSIRVYNEGEINGYADLIVDSLPSGLEFYSSEYKGIDYGWTLVEGTENTYQTDYLSYENDENRTTDQSTMIKAYTGVGEADYKEIFIVCKVKESASKEDSLLNVAQIADDSDGAGRNINDKDSIPGTLDDENKWKNEDDLDIENLQLQEFDLALRKFITEIENGEKTEKVTTRMPQVSYNEETKQLEYTHTKDALVVHVGDTVIYTLRVYNEGDIDGYASEVKDDIPEYLEYLPKHETNIENEWVMYDKDGKETENVEEAVFIKTEHLAKGKGVEADEESEETNLIRAFDAETEISDKNPDYKEVKVAFKVKDPNSTEYEIVNFAQISNDSDSEGDPIKDKDSIPDNGDKDPKEDDEDIEKVRVEYFDLSLLKYVTKVLVNENGKERVIETGNVGDENDIIPHVQIDKKNIDKTVVKFAYTIQITNEGQIAGEATEITDYVPEGLVFMEEDNELWTDEGNNVISTMQLKGTTLQTGETSQVEVVLRWINERDNMGMKINVAEISEDYNEENIPDRDSTPDNKKEGEDDIDKAEVLLSAAQGGGIQSIYINLSLMFLAIILVGGVLIKKFVL